MNDNLKLWDSVEKTNPAHTTEVTFGRKITAIDPYQQIKNATAKFGPVGIGWGWSVVKVEHLPTNELGLLIRMWHTDKANTFDQWGQASLYIDNAQKKKDTDCFKKATTDGITKCLSLIGFNADVFLKKFNDNKYVQEMINHFAPKDEETELIIINSGDAQWVVDNWSDVIAKKWPTLTEELTTILNNTYNKGTAQ
jgi:hypothetical protein